MHVAQNCCCEWIHCISGWCHILNNMIGDMFLPYHDLFFDGDVMLLSYTTWKDISIVLVVATFGVVESRVTTFGVTVSGVATT